MFKLPCILILIFFSTPLTAADSLLTLKQQLDRLQRDVNDLSKTVYSESTKIDNNSEVPNVDISNLTSFDLRIYDLEKDIKIINQNLEELVFKIDDIINLYEDLNLKISTQMLSNQNLKTDSDTQGNNNELNGKGELDTNNNTLGDLVITSSDIQIDKKKLNDELNDEETLNNKDQNIKLSPDDEFQRAFDMLRNQNFEEAKFAFQQFIKNNKDNSLSGSAHYWMGEIFLLQKSYREAALVLAEGYSKFPKSVKAPDLLYKLADALIKIDKKMDSCNTLSKFIEEFSNNRLIEKVKKKIIDQDCQVAIE